MGQLPEPDRRRGIRSKPTAEVGVPTFENNQWTFEGQVERLGTFSSGVTRAQGWKRWVGVFLVVAMLAPMVIGTVVWLLQLIL